MTGYRSRPAGVRRYSKRFGWAEYRLLSRMPLSTSVFNRAAMVSRGAPVRRTISSKRRLPRKTSRMASRAHFSPTTSRERAMEQIRGSAVSAATISIIHGRSEIWTYSSDGPIVSPDFGPTRRIPGDHPARPRTDAGTKSPRLRHRHSDPPGGGGGRGAVAGRVHVQPRPVHREPGAADDHPGVPWCRAGLALMGAERVHDRLRRRPRAGRAVGRPGRSQTGVDRRADRVRARIRGVRGRSGDRGARRSPGGPGAGRRPDGAGIAVSAPGHRAGGRASGGHRQLVGHRRPGRRPRSGGRWAAGASQLAVGVLGEPTGGGGGGDGVRRVAPGEPGARNPTPP